MAYQRTKHRFRAVGDDAPGLPICGTPAGDARPIGTACAQDPNAAPAVVDEFVQSVENLWQGTGFATPTYDSSLPDCATAQVGQKCNSVTAAQAAANASSSSTTRMLLLGGVALVGAYLLFGGKKGGRR